MRPASELPSLPVVDLPEVERARLDAFARLVAPTGWIESLAAHGWLYAGSNEHILFFERPGYWLRIYDRPSWSASIEPTHHRVPRPYLGSAGYGLMFPDDQRAPEFTGRGAHLRAQQQAAQIYAEQVDALAALGIELTGVGVLQFRGSGSGGHVCSRMLYAGAGDLQQAA